jgi:hypothetical protein
MMKLLFGTEPHADRLDRARQFRNALGARAKLMPWCRLGVSAQNSRVAPGVD